MLDGIEYWDELKNSPSQMEICFAIFANVLELDDGGEPVNEKYAECRAATCIYRYCTGPLPLEKRTSSLGNASSTESLIRSLPNAFNSGVPHFPAADRSSANRPHSSPRRRRRFRGNVPRNCVRRL